MGCIFVLVAKSESPRRHLPRFYKTDPVFSRGVRLVCDWGRVERGLHGQVESDITRLDEYGPMLASIVDEEKSPGSDVGARNVDLGLRNSPSMA
jgi:hypothetical protein